MDSHEADALIPSIDEQLAFVDWLKVILRDPYNVARRANYLIQSHDWSRNRIIEISSRQTKSGRPEQYTFA